MATAEIIDEILKTHNKYRAQHHAPNLEISDTLNKFAEEWAKNLATKDKLEHRQDNPYGENIYMAGSTDPNWKLKGDTVVKSWYDEIKSYKFGEPSPSNMSKVGHFTQLVWKGSTTLGIGEAKSKAGKVYVVCNYDPPGNVLREFAKNVFPVSKPSKNENSNGQTIDEEYEEEREKIVLTPSQEKMGIQFVQPNTRIVESMERLYAVPSEKIRVWSVWLTKVEEKANEWNSWLRSHISLVLRLSEHLRRAEGEVKEDETSGVVKSRVGEQYREGGEREVKEASMTADGGHGLEDLSPETREPTNQDHSQRELRGTSSSASTDNNKSDEMEVAKSAVEVKSSDGAEATVESSTESREEATGEYTTDGNEAKYEMGVSGDENEMMEGGTEELKKIAWPIGVPWEPVVPTATKERKVSKKKEEKVKVIPIPENEQDMQRLINDIKEQATVYRSLYKHWLEVGDQATKEIMNRTAMTSEQVPTLEDIPYFFYVNAEADIEIGVEHDDETILLPDLTRERITSDFTPLHFNLADKPGKGGKPWL